VQQLGGLQVEALAEDVQPEDLDVLAALPLGQLRVEVAGLGVHQVRRERARVPPEQRVGQRAVAPGEAGQVHPDDQRDQRVEQPVERLGPQHVREERPVRQRELQVPGDQDGLQRLAVGVDRSVTVATASDRGEVDPLERAQQVVLLFGDPLAGLLQGVDRLVELDEPDDVPGDALRQSHQVVGGPLLERDAPRQIQQRRVDEGGRDAHRTSVPASSARRGRRWLVTQERERRNSTYVPDMT
jgi:hypothetical protein